MENGEVSIYSSSYSYHPDKIEFSETDEAKKSTTCFTLEKLADNKTRLTLDFYLEKSIAGPLLFRLTRKKKMEAGFRQSLRNLVGLIKKHRTLNLNH